MRQSGFTLLEIIVVVILLGIVGLSISLTSPVGLNQALSAEGMAGKLLQDLRFTKILSMSHNERYRLVVNANAYQIQDENGTPVQNPETGGNQTPYPVGLTITPATTVVFDGLGHPYDNALTPLNSTLIYTVTLGGESRTVSVTPQTGLVQ